jgi:hypothetical protein
MGARPVTGWSANVGSRRQEQIMRVWKTVVGIVGLACMSVAAAPQLKSSWRNIDPAATPVSNVVVIGFTRDVASRRSMEDALTAEIRKNGGKAEPSYTLVPGDLPKDAAVIKEKVVAAGFDGAVIVRVAGMSQEQAWDPGFVAVMPGYYATTWSYWGYWYPYAWDPFYLREETVVRIETVVYAVNGVMIWSGLSVSTNPGSVRTLIRDVAVPVGAELKKRNVVR